MTRAALRDASWFNRPSTDKPVRYHIVRDEVHAGESACGLAVDYQGPHDATDPQVDAASVPKNLRCMRPACRSRWPDGVDGPDHQTIPPEAP